MTMVKLLPRIFLVGICLFGFLACDTAKKVELEVEVAVSLDGEPVSGAGVLVDGAQVGVTGGDGRFLYRMQKLPGSETSLAVEKKIEGYRIQPWQDTFVTKLTQPGVIERYGFKADLQAYKSIVFVVTKEGEPVEGAVVDVQGSKVTTGADGQAVYEFRESPSRGLRVSVEENGFEPWKKSIAIQPGQRYTIALHQKRSAPPTAAAAALDRSTGEKAAVAETARSAKALPAAPTATLYLSALTESYGNTAGLPGVQLALNGAAIGKTNSKGQLTHEYRGDPLDSARVVFTAPGFVPEKWETSVTLKGKRSVQRYFYPAAPRPIRIGLHGYVNNSPETDLSEVIEGLETQISNSLSAYASFQQVPKSRLKRLMLQAGKDMETASTKGWQNSSLANAVDLILAGNVSMDESGIGVETTVMAADGQIILSQLNRARKRENIGGVAKLIVNSFIDQFPFEGVVTAVEDGRYRINLGTADHKIRRGNQFRCRKAETGRSGKISGFSEAGLLRVVETDGQSSVTEIAEFSESAAIGVGDRVVRRVYLEERMESERASLTLRIKGGLAPEARPLWGVNIYLDNTWVGTTGADGRATVPIGLYSEHDLLLSRHGYQQLHDTISVDSDGQVKEFDLQVASAMFKVESEPSGATVFVDGVEIGQTPMLEGKPVNFGFRKVTLTVGGDYRDWEQIIDFDRPEVERTGMAKVVFAKDYLKIGRQAEQAGNVEEAIRAYASTQRGESDYSECRCRLAQLYMDEKGDHDGAIREFENVLALPENRQIVYKQFAVTYTNLGHAYYERGNTLVRTDPQAAAENFAQAIEKLNIAKQNTRFFPSQHFEEAVHDTYYYNALAYHKLYLVSKKRPLVAKADLAWREYFDFFPQKLEGKGNFTQMRSAAEKYWQQIKDLM
jgi:hypothetical protein